MAEITLNGTKPMLMSNIRLANPLDEYARELKSYTSKRKKRLGAMVTDRDRDRMEAARTAVSKDHLLALLRRKWALGDGTMVEVGRATLPEIRQRLDLMRRQRAGLDESIRVLEAIEAELERTGARCLDDLMKTQGVAA